MAAAASKPKPKKPRPDFPLFPHASGQWAKKIRGNLYYFGVWSDPDAALQKYCNQKDDIQAGRKPREVSAEGPEIADLLDEFLVAKRHLVETGELSIRSFRDYHSTCDRIIAQFGATRRVADLRSDDFVELRTTLAKNRGPVALGNEIGRVRVVFNFGFESGLLERPVRFGPIFKKPSRKTLKRERRKSGPRMFAAADLRLMLGYLDGNEVTLDRKDEETGEPATLAGKRNPVLKAMLLLGVNAAYGQTDVATLPFSALDLEKGWATFPRPKTEADRRCKLWPETAVALREAIAARPAPKDEEHADLVFITKYGAPWVRVLVTDAEDEKDETITAIDAVAQEFRKLLAKLELSNGLNYYSLRRTFRTIADATGDEPAVKLVMGHADAADDMGAVYRQGIADARLEKVAEHVHRWLWPLDERK